MKPIIAAYYFPNFHTDPRNEAVHGKGWTEWQLVRYATPRFPSHVQPLVPAWGYEDEADPVVMAKKIDAASSHGVDAFLFDWYYYDETLFLERCLEQGFMKAGNVDKMQFSLMWANHDWGNAHPVRRGDTIVHATSGEVGGEAFEKMTDLIIERYFRHPSHLAIDGAPFFSIYNLNSLVKGFGGSLEETRAALARFTQKTIKAGFPGLHLNAIGYYVQVLDGELGKLKTVNAAEMLGFTSIGHYVWAHFVPLSGPELTKDFTVAKTEYLAALKKNQAESSLPVYPNVTMGWDSSPRTVQSDLWTTSPYPWTQILTGNTPAEFGKAFQEIRAFAIEHNLPMVSLNAWNEWTEGSYLEPDTTNGLGYLEAIRDGLRTGEPE